MSVTDSAPTFHFMQTAIDTIAARVGIERDVAERAVGIMLSLVKSDGDPALVPKLLDAMPGSRELAEAHGGRGGGLMGALGGAFGGGALSAFGKLKQAGLNTEQIRTAGEILFDHAKQQAGEPLVEQVVSSVPGLGPYV